MHCKAHGGGRRCVFEGCTKGAEGSTALCKAHGGGKRCLFEGGGVCPKSVHGGTDYCVAHGGGKRCAHGGGRRCRSEGCGKSAQGSTDFCKAHGGGKRCSWATGCEKFARGRSGLCAAHGSMAANQAANQAEELFRGVVVGSASATTRSSMDNGCSSAISTLSGTAESPAITAGRRQLLLSLPPWMRPASGSSDGGVDDAKDSGRNSLKFALPEGRVHGGGLLSLFGGDLRNAIDADLGPQDEAT
ncbi:unnamed protein product [Spirodela intermedia]|uniref:WRKY19-like zinc finger domain-containing protein n=1 Tax=Spirodela intermedia TaxID=51605 RepID=A0A7I8INR2_SPIIN|nr:unnamed protein product [Spirodela intermedia]CAA6659536.1 unnamed protein product [Spirodela intermedia]